MKLITVFAIRYKNTEKSLTINCSENENILPAVSEAIERHRPDVLSPDRNSISLCPTDNRLQITSSEMLTINGVSTKKRILKKGDRIVLGEIRLFFESFHEVPAIAEIPEPQQAAGLKLPAPPGFRFDWKTHPLRAAALVCFISAACIIAGCLAIPHGREETVHTQTPPAAMKADSAPAESLQPAASAPPQQAKKPDSGLVTVPPGGIIPDMDLDILFIHAHPDDESLDFGCLMALADSEGLKTGLLTFTDGESGLDLYPRRPVTGLYPDHYMEGAELANVRKNELAGAAETLGVDLLIRLGLRNNPYSSIKDELPPEEILEIWGGVNNLKEKLREIISITRPETVVAPEKPGKAREHFEHEAVGLLTSAVMSGYEPDDYKAPKRYITSIDPRQHHLYPEAETVNARIRVRARKDAETEITLRELQLAALMNHRTQNDAINVGTGFLPKYPAEYYKVQYWRSNRSWEDNLRRPRN